MYAGKIVDSFASNARAGRRGAIPIRVASSPAGHRVPIPVALFANSQRDPAWLGSTRALDIRNLNVVRGGRRVVGGVNLTLEEGAGLGIVGEPDSRKSTCCVSAV